MDSGWLWCVSAGPPVITNAPLWCGKLTVGEAKPVWGQEVQGKCVFSAQICCKPKNGLKNKVFKNKQTKNKDTGKSQRCLCVLVTWFQLFVFLLSRVRLVKRWQVINSLNASSWRKQVFQNSPFYQDLIYNWEKILFIFWIWESGISSRV